MPVQIVRHHGGAQDSDGDGGAVAVHDRQEARQHFAERRPGPQDLDAEADRHDGDQREHEGLDRPDAEVLEPQEQQGIGRGEQNSDQQRNVEQQVESDGGAKHFRQVAGGDGDFA